MLSSYTELMNTLMKSKCVCVLPLKVLPARSHKHEESVFKSLIACLGIIFRLQTLDAQLLSLMTLTDRSQCPLTASFHAGPVTKAASGSVLLHYGMDGKREQHCRQSQTQFKLSKGLCEG